ncbi:MAG TPA: hypothetical protein VL974_13300 [Magnetospirillum sp.]|jgi:hypothetical protein|nr:hypothetical protein [Magnetospirillum sp.]
MSEIRNTGGMTIPAPPHAGSTAALDWVVAGAVGGLIAALQLLATVHFNLDSIGSQRYPLLAASLLFLLGAMLLAFVILRRINRGRSLPQRLGLAVFLGIPCYMFGAFVLLYILTDLVRVNLMRMLFDTFVTLLPPGLFYLLLQGSRVSLLNTFLSDLGRLGLLDATRGETEKARFSRVRTYLQRFQAAFGSPSSELLDDILKEIEAGGELTYQTDVSFRLPISALAPVSLATLATAVGWLVVMPPLQSADPTTFPLTLTQEPVAYAFVGAYFFYLPMLIWRYMGRDLTPNAYVSVIKRIVLSTLGCWAAIKLFPDLLTPERNLALGFTVGFFPVIVWDFMANFLQNTVRVPTSVPRMQDRATLDRLDGMTIWHQSRLEDEDISNVQNLATADVVHLLINTRFDAQRLVSWIDQALLLSALACGDETEGAKKRDTLRTYGIHTATDLVGAHNASWLNDAAELTWSDRKIALKQWVSSLAAGIETKPNYHLVRNWKLAALPAARA